VRRDPGTNPKVTAPTKTPVMAKPDTGFAACRPLRRSGVTLFHLDHDTLAKLFFAIFRVMVEGLDAVRSPRYNAAPGA
jgi:hypothetical protein